MLQEYERKRCIKINLITAGIYVVLVILSLIINYMMYNNSMNNLDGGGLESEVAIIFVIVSGLIITTIVLILYSIIFPVFIKLYNDFKDTLKLLIGVGICNLIVAIFLWRSVNIIAFIIYLLISIGGMIMSAKIKHMIKSRNSDME